MTEHTHAKDIRSGFESIEEIDLQQDRVNQVVRAAEVLDGLEKGQSAEAVDALSADLVSDANEEYGARLIRAEEAEEALLVGELSILAHHGSMTPRELAHTPTQLLADTLVTIEQTQGMQKLTQLVEAIEDVPPESGQQMDAEETHTAPEVAESLRQKAKQWVAEHTVSIESNDPLGPPRAELTELSLESIDRIPVELQQSVADELVESSGLSDLDKYIDKFDSLSVDTAEQLLNNGYASPISHNNVFPGLELSAERVDALFEQGLGVAVLQNIERFEGLILDNRLASELVERGHMHDVLACSDQFPEYAFNETHVETLLSEGEFYTLLKFSDKLGINKDDTLAQRIMDADGRFVLAHNLDAFTGLSKHIAEALLHEEPVYNYSGNILRAIKNFDITPEDILELPLNLTESFGGLDRLSPELQVQLVHRTFENLDPSDEWTAKGLISDMLDRGLTLDRSVLSRMLVVDAERTLYSLRYRGFESFKDLEFDQALLDEMIAALPEGREGEISSEVLEHFPVDVRDDFVERIATVGREMRLYRDYENIVSPELQERIQRVEEEYGTWGKRRLSVYFKEFPGTKLERALHSDDPMDFSSTIDEHLRWHGGDPDMLKWVLEKSDIPVPESLRALSYLQTVDQKIRYGGNVHEFIKELLIEGKARDLLILPYSLDGMWSYKELTVADMTLIERFYFATSAGIYKFQDYVAIIDQLGDSQLPEATRSTREIFGANISWEMTRTVAKVLEGNTTPELAELGIDSTGSEAIVALREKIGNIKVELLANQDSAATLEALNKSSIALEVLKVVTRYEQAQFGDRDITALMELVDNFKTVVEDGGATLIGPEYTNSRTYEIPTNAGMKERVEWTEDTLVRYESLRSELNTAQELNETPGGMNQIFDRLSEDVRGIVEAHKETLARGRDAKGKPLTERGRDYIAKTITELNGLIESKVEGDHRTDALHSLRDFESNFLLLSQNKSLHGRMRQAVFAWALRKNPDWSENLRVMKETPNIDDITRQIEFVDHIVSQETFAQYFNDKQAAQRFRDIVNTKALSEALERQSQLISGSKKTTDLQFMPNRGLLMELSGHIGDACWANKYTSISEEMPNMTAVIMKQHVGDPSREKLVGSAMFIETVDKDTQEPLLVIRGLNPIENFINQVSPESFFDSTVEYARTIATAKNMKLGVVIDDHSGGSATNRPLLFGYLSALKSKLSLVRVPHEGTTFNGYNITDKVYAL
jgi:hypothetical protein